MKTFEQAVEMLAEQAYARYRLGEIAIWVNSPINTVAWIYDQPQNLVLDRARAAYAAKVNEHKLGIK